MDLRRRLATTHRHTHTHAHVPPRYEFRPCNATITPGPREGWDPAAQAAEADAAPREGLCCYWIAASDIGAGEEACLNYGYLTPDVVRCG